MGPGQGRQEGDDTVSAETYAALEAAIRAHVADSNAEWPILTDWVLLTASAGNDALLTGYTDACSESPTHALEGLLHRGLRRCVARDDGDE